MEGKEGGKESANLEDVKALVLHHLAVVAQQIHAQLQVVTRVDVGGHDVVVGAVEQDLAQQLDRLPLGHVRARLHQHLVVGGEEALEVDLEVLRDDLLVSSKDFLKYER